MSVAAPERVSAKLRRGAQRTMPVYGVCVHTTSGGAARKAKPGGPSPLQMVLDYYVNGREGFPHYVIGYDGSLNRVCAETEVAWHAGWLGHGRRRWASWTAPAWWSSVWSRWQVTTPAGLLPPRADDPNSVYIGVELLADKTGYGFTSAQYDALARLVVDVFRRYGLPLAAPPNPHLLGHEDLEPIDRANADGGWDPGAHRRAPQFSWSGLWSRMQAAGPTTVAPPVPTPAPATDLAGAFARGERDVNRLTDIAFNARHPERGGRPIVASEAPAAAEWVAIRDQVVRPMLQPAAGSSRWVALAAMLDRYRGDIPLHFLLGWIDVESGGRNDVVTRPPLDERGFFQISRAESADARPPLQHARITTDPDYSVQAGLQLVRYYADLARRRFPWIPAGSELFWRIVKLQHAMGSGLAWQMLTQMHARGIETNWPAIERYELTDGPKLHALMRVQPGRFGRNVDGVFTRGRAIAQRLGR
jgi:N-acetylmuramoyl-L-alanine amidase